MATKLKPRESCNYSLTYMLIIHNIKLRDTIFCEYFGRVKNHICPSEECIQQKGKKSK